MSPAGDDIHDADARPPLLKTPRLRMTKFHGVLAPHSKLCANWLSPLTGTERQGDSFSWIPPTSC